MQLLHSGTQHEAKCSSICSVLQLSLVHGIRLSGIPCKDPEFLTTSWDSTISGNLLSHNPFLNNFEFFKSINIGHFFYTLKEAKHGSGKGTLINAFSCMKSGLKNCDANGNAGPIPERTKKLVCSRTFYLVSCFSIWSLWLIIVVISRMTTMKHCKKSIQRTDKSNLLMVKLHMILVVACPMVVLQ